MVVKNYVRKICESLEMYKRDYGVFSLETRWSKAHFLEI